MLKRDSVPLYWFYVLRILKEQLENALQKMDFSQTYWQNLSRGAEIVQNYTEIGGITGFGLGEP